MNSILSFVAASLLVIGLVENGFEMRKIRLSVRKDKESISKNVFLNKNNWKWCIDCNLSHLVDNC